MAGINIIGDNPGPLGGNALVVPRKFLPPIIEISDGIEFPSDESAWLPAPDLTLVRCTVAASSVDPGSCEVTYRYGLKTKMPYDAGFIFRAPIERAGQWLRFSIISDDLSYGMVQFVGRIDQEPRTLTGSTAAPSGTQNFIAQGPLKILQKISVSQSVFYDPTAMKFNEVGWIPAMNRRDARGLLVGNRNDNPTANDDGAGGPLTNYCYGGKKLWTHLDYCNYLLTNFVWSDPQTNATPTWTMAGQTDILQGITTTVDFGETETVAEMLKKLINPKYGVDFYVAPTATGFAITVFALSDKPISFAGQTMPANSLGPTITILRDKQIDLVETHVVSTTERRVDRIVITGKRIVVCGTLWAAGLSPGDLPGNQPNPPSADPMMPPNPPVTLPATLVKRWSDAAETDYKTGGTSTEPEKKDLYRHGPQFRGVYQHLGAPDDWDLDGGTWCVATKNDGSLSTGAFQTKVRETLGWIPLREGYDYRSVMTTTAKNGDVSFTSATDNTDGTVEAETSPPLAWVYDELPSKSSSQQYVKCEDVGIGVGRPHLDWGVFLHASPNHRLALDSLSNTDLATVSDPTVVTYNYNTTVATIAIESDHRLALVYDVPAAQQAGDGSVMIINDNSAELWVVLPGTIVGQDDNGKLIAFGGAKTNGTANSAPKTPTIMRSDVPRLALEMCGAISRYSMARARAQYTVKGFSPWGNLLGRMAVVTQTGDQSPTPCVVTSVSWELGQSPETLVKTGYA